TFEEELLQHAFRKRDGIGGNQLPPLGSHLLQERAKVGARVVHALSHFHNVLLPAHASLALAIDEGYLHALRNADEILKLAYRRCFPPGRIGNEFTSPVPGAIQLVLNDGVNRPQWSREKTTVTKLIVCSLAACQRGSDNTSLDTVLRSNA